MEIHANGENMMSGNTDSKIPKLHEDDPKTETQTAPQSNDNCDEKIDDDEIKKLTRSEWKKQLWYKNKDSRTSTTIYAHGNRKSEPATPQEIQNKLGGFDFYHHILQSPKHILAPMVDQSELPFRMLCRKYNTHLCFTPMLHSKNFVISKTYRRKYFTTCPEDRPLVAQFCGNEPEWLLKATRLVERDCDAVDINLGCPQRIAKKGNYGAFLMDDPQTVFNIGTLSNHPFDSLVKTLHENLRVPIFCKIRVFADAEKTIQFAKMLESAGCQLLTVHGRTREMKGLKTGLCDWTIIQKVKEALNIPVISNGNIRHYNDVIDCLRHTQCDGVMSAEGLLANPALFSGQDIDCFTLCYEYLDICDKYPTSIVWAVTHVIKILASLLTDELRELLLTPRDIPTMREALKEVEDCIKVTTCVVFRLQFKMGIKPQPRQKKVVQREVMDTFCDTVLDAMHHADLDNNNNSDVMCDCTE